VLRFPHKIIAHHSHILMLQAVAMLQKHSWIIIKINQNSDSFSGHQQYRIFPSFIHITVMHDSASLNYLKLLAVQVDGVRVIWQTP